MATKKEKEIATVLNDLVEDYGTAFTSHIRSSGSVEINYKQFTNCLVRHDICYDARAIALRWDVYCVKHILQEGETKHTTATLSADALKFYCPNAFERLLATTDEAHAHTRAHTEVGA